jgi:hypothetical protein
MGLVGLIGLKEVYKSYKSPTGPIHDSPRVFCSFVARSDGKGRNRRAGFIFHFQYYIYHLPLRAKAAPTMTNGKPKIENGKYFEIFD